MTTPNLALTEVAANVLQPSVPINASLQVIDALLHLSPQDKDLAAPPITTDADKGKTWIVAASPTGTWAGQAGKIALCIAANNWTFLTPKEGWRADLRDEDVAYRYTGTAWALVAAASVSKPVIVLAIASGVVNIDCALGDHFTLVLTANVTSITFSNLPASGYAKEISVRLVQDATGARTVALPASFKATGGSDTTVASAASSYTLLTGVTFDQGTRWAYAMQDVAA